MIRYHSFLRAQTAQSILREAYWPCFD